MWLARVEGFHRIGVNPRFDLGSRHVHQRLGRIDLGGGTGHGQAEHLFAFFRLADLAGNGVLLADVLCPIQIRPIPTSTA
jgi:hypothetical protein